MYESVNMYVTSTYGFKGLGLNGTNLHCKPLQIQEINFDCCECDNILSTNCNGTHSIVYLCYVNVNCGN